MHTPCATNRCRLEVGGKGAVAGHPAVAVARPKYGPSLLAPGLRGDSLPWAAFEDYRLLRFAHPKTGRFQDANRVGGLLAVGSLAGRRVNPNPPLPGWLKPLLPP